MNTKSNNDLCFIKQQFNQSKSYNNYMMYPGKYYNNKPCRIPFGLVGGNNVSLYSGNLVNLESELRGQTRRLTKCNCSKYKPNCLNCECNRGIPCGCLNCQQKMINLPTCKSNKQNYYKPSQFKPFGCSYTKKKGWF